MVSLPALRSIGIMVTLGCVTVMACRTDDTVDDAGPQYATEFTSVELARDAPAPLQLAVQACVGLKNRKLGGSVYVQMESHDDEWLTELDLEPAEVISATDFLDACMAEFPSCVRYSYEDQQELLPSILTAASALEALPLAEGTSTCSDPVFDATVEFAERNTPYLAGQYVFENYVEQTTGLAMLNPGYNQQADDLANPELNRDMPSAMVDLVFSKKLFVVFLINGCIEGESENELLDAIVNAGHWATPLGVYGYNNSWLTGGYLYEAQTRCLESRNMGAIPTETGNLSFFSTRRAPIVLANPLDPKPLDPNPLEEVEYDPSKTYVSFIVGDGDNIRFIMTTRNVWLRQRLADCAQTDNACEPITWSISPHLTHLAPDVLEWYYERSRETGKDYFTLPPSGHLYAYPSSLKDEEQDEFVKATERDAALLDLHTTVHWEWFDSWDKAEAEFLPKYARENGVIRAVFPVNVPYFVNAFPDWSPDEFYRVLVGEDGGEMAVFRPRQWRGIHDSSDPFFLPPQDMADELAGYPLGTVTGVYMTSDGGLNLENSFMELVRLLPAHVELVSADTAAKFALQANGS